MGDATLQTVYFYNRHPISRDIILAKLRASRGHLEGLRPDELFAHDQDQYGGLAATDELARGTQIGNRSRVTTQKRHFDEPLRDHIVDAGDEFCWYLMTESDLGCAKTPQAEKRTLLRQEGPMWL